MSHWARGSRLITQAIKSHGFEMTARAVELIERKRETGKHLGAFADHYLVERLEIAALEARAATPLKSCSDASAEALAKKTLDHLARFGGDLDKALENGWEQR